MIQQKNQETIKSMQNYPVSKGFDYPFAFDRNSIYIHAVCMRTIHRLILACTDHQLVLKSPGLAHIVAVLIMPCVAVASWPRSYKTFSMLNSTKHGINVGAHKG